MDVEDVWNSFFTYSLRLDYHERKATMELPHSAPSQAERLRGLLAVRNSQMARTGQEEWNHACDLCCYICIDPESDPKEPRYRTSYHFNIPDNYLTLTSLCSFYGNRRRHDRPPLLRCFGLSRASTIPSKTCIASNIRNSTSSVALLPAPRTLSPASALVSTRPIATSSSIIINEARLCFN